MNSVTWMTLIKNKSVAFTMLACALGVFNDVFWIGWIASMFKKQGIHKSNFGYIYGSLSFLFLFSCTLYAKYESRIPR